MVVPTHRRLIGVAALALWCVSLALPVETDCGVSYAARGYDILGVGWLGPSVSVGLVGWYANPFMLWQSGRLLLNRRPGVIGSGIGAVLALSSFFWTCSPTDLGCHMICQWHLGFYLWIACGPLLAIAALAEWPAYVDHKLKSRREAS